jgi:hypothetical protein
VSAHVVQWVTASPLWPSALAKSDDGARETSMRQPALLRFERDSFMTDAARLLEHDPAELTGHVAEPVTYRLPAPGEKEPPTPQQLKLYQAAHGHFYLVAATLVCRMPGLPEHDVNTAARERVSFVLRRPETGKGEWAWVDDPKVRNGKSWKLLAGDAVEGVDAEEDLLPLFPLRYTSAGRLRRLYVGLVPTSSAETFKAGGTFSPLAGPKDGAGAPPEDPRPAALAAKVTEPLRLLQASATTAPTGAKNPAQIVAAMLAQQIEASRFVLLDFAEFLHTNLGWFAPGWTAPAPGKEAALWATLAAPAVTGGSVSWRDALAKTWADRLVLSGEATGTLTAPALNLRTPFLGPDTIDTEVAKALPPLPPRDPNAPATSIQGDTAPPPPVPKIDLAGDALYVLRCVYQRPDCGPLHPDVVSEPTREFRIAGFLDLDAPVRPIMISMPVGTGIKDLRKLRKNVSFLLSDQLRAQMNRVTDLNAALKGQFADGQPVDVGLICSFSIPIITICALIVLMIFISLLNIVFWWMPFLRICFPIGLKAK